MSEQTMQPQIRKVGHSDQYFIVQFFFSLYLGSVWCMTMKAGHSDLQNYFMYGYDCLGLCRYDRCFTLE